MSDEYNNTNEEMENGSLNENQNENKETRQEPGEIPTPEKNHAMHVLIKKRKTGGDDKYEVTENGGTGNRKKRKNISRISFPLQISHSSRRKRNSLPV